MKAQKHGLGNLGLNDGTPLGFSQSVLAHGQCSFALGYYMSPRWGFQSAARGGVRPTIKNSGEQDASARAMHAPREFL